MDATEVLEAYINDTVRLLPTRQRDDIAVELRSLLSDELQARSRESGCPPDAVMALALVRGHGRPNEFAARYQLPSAIIDPADSTSFGRAAFIGAGTLAILAAVSRRVPALPETADNLLKIGLLVWLGLLVVVFGAKNVIRQRWPGTMDWTPRDRDRTNRVATAVVVPIAAAVVVLYGAPAWVLDSISGGRLDTAWAAYTTDFQRRRLPCFIGLMVGLLALLSFVAIEGRWRRLTRRINIGLNMALACLVLSFAADGYIFESSVVDQIARNVLGLVALIYVPSAGVQLYGEIGRLDQGASAKSESFPSIGATDMVD